jgi:hypothetical protein
VPLGYDTSEGPVRDLLGWIDQSGVAVLSVYSSSWVDAEATPGVFDLGYGSLFAVLGDRRYEITADFSTPIGFDGPAAPAHIGTVSYDDPALVDGYLRYLSAQLAMFDDRLRRVVLHTEAASTMLDAGSPEREAYCALLETAIAQLHAARPGLRVGTYASGYDDDDFLRCINRRTDFFGVSINLAPPDEGIDAFRAQLNRARALAAGRPVAVVEAGFPSSERLGSSEAIQAAFVGEVFDAVDADRASIEYVSFYTVFDEDPVIARAWIDATFPDWTQELRDALFEWVTTLGLVTHDGRPKPAWKALTDGAARP